MGQSQVIQFVCFDTAVSTLDFLANWQSYAQGFLSQGIQHITLHESVEREKHFRFISKNTWLTDAFFAVFPDGKMPWSFPVGSIQVTQAGGYYPVHLDQPAPVGSQQTKLLILGKGKSTPLPTTATSSVTRNVYEPVSKDSRYDFVWELFAPAADLPALSAGLADTEHHVYAEILQLP